MTSLSTTSIENPRGARQRAAHLGMATLVAIATIAGANPAEGAAAVAYDPMSKVFAYQTGETVPGAAKAVEASCRELGGRNCAPIESCAAPGFGAIAANEISSDAAVCGGASESEAREQALDRCNALAPAGAPCAILSTFRDTIAAAPDLAYFEGTWGTDCDGAIRYKFQSVSPRELAMLSCSGVSAVNCRRLGETFSPGASKGVFIHPTTTSRLTRRGPDQLEWWHVSQSDILNRCVE